MNRGCSGPRAAGPSSSTRVPWAPAGSRRSTRTRRRSAGRPRSGAHRLPPRCQASARSRRPARPPRPGPAAACRTWMTVAGGRSSSVRALIVRSASLSLAYPMAALRPITHPIATASRMPPVTSASAAETPSSATGTLLNCSARISRPERVATPGRRSGPRRSSLSAATPWRRPVSGELSREVLLWPSHSASSVRHRLATQSRRLARLAAIPSHPPAALRPCDRRLDISSAPVPNRGRIEEDENLAGQRTGRRGDDPERRRS